MEQHKDDEDVQQAQAMLAEYFKQLRMDRGWSQGMVERRSGLKRSLVAKLETGDAVLGATYHRYASALGMRLALLPVIPDHRVGAGMFKRSPGQAHSSGPLQNLEGASSRFVSELTIVNEDAFALLLARVLSVILDVETGNKEPRILDRREFISSLAALLVGASTPELVRRLFDESRCPFGVPSDVEALAQACTEYLRDQDAAGAGDALCDAAMAMHKQVGAWARDSRLHVKTALALDALGCELGAWVGWLAVDRNRYGLAERYLESAITQARIVGRPNVEARALENLSALYDRQGHLERSLRVANAGTAVAERDGCPKLHALLLLRESQVQAHLGNEEGFKSASGRARSLLRSPRGQGSAPWLSFLTTGAYDIGMAQLTLGHPDAAVLEFQSIVDSGEAETRRDVVDAMVQVAKAQAMLGNMTDAAAYGLQILPDVQNGSSLRLREEMRHLRTLLQPARMAGGPAREFVAAYDTGPLGRMAAFA